MKVVIVTNILIGSTWDESSYSKRVVDLVIRGEIEACATHPIIRENQLLLKQAVPNPRQKEFLEKYFANVKEVPIKHHRRVVRFDPEDDKFINAALSARAEYIITNDSHLLEVDGYEGLKIIRPKDFWCEYKGEDIFDWKDWARGIMR